MSRWGIWFGLSLSLAACGAACRAPRDVRRPNASPIATAAPSSGQRTSTQPEPERKTALNGGLSTGAPAPPETLGVCAPDTTHAFTRIHGDAVTSLGVGEGGRAAAYAPNHAVIFDGQGFRPLPLPPLPDNAEVRIFFGRDNQPRLMGFAGAPGSGDVKSIYWRFRHGRFQPEPSELGPLGSPQGALYGVLGFADPEVVCRPGVTCLVKRISGWGRAPAHDRPVPIVLSNDRVLALHDDHVEQLTKAAWTALSPARAFDRPKDAWQEPNGALFIAEGRALARLAEGAWTTLLAPIGRIEAVFGRSADDLYVAGAAGAAHYDGRQFRCIRDVPGPLAVIARVGDDIWLAGATGIFRSSKP